MVPVVFPASGTVWLFCLTALALLLIPGPAVLYVVAQGAPTCPTSRGRDGSRTAGHLLRLRRRLHRPRRRRRAREAELAVRSSPCVSHNGRSRWETHTRAGRPPLPFCSSSCSESPLG